MKKVILSAAAILVAFSFTSCKKEYDCSCKWSYDLKYDDGTSTFEFSDSGTKSYPLGKIKKKDAESACDDKAALVKSAEGLNYTAQQNETYTSSVDCTETKK